MTQKSLCMLLVLLCVIPGCSPSAKITGSWKSPEISTSGYQDLFVVALINENFLAKKTIEDDLDQLLLEKGIQAESDLDKLKPGLSAKKGDHAAIANALKESRKDGVLTVAVLDQTTETRYVPGTVDYYNPMLYGGFYGRFGGYYGMYQPMVYSPGYYATDKNYYLEINLYDTDSEKLVWSAQSQITNPSNLDKAANDFANSVVNQLIKDGIVVPKT